MSWLYHYRVSRHVAVSPSTVWDVVSDGTGMPRWTPFRRAVLERPGQHEPVAGPDQDRRREYLETPLQRSWLRARPRRRSRRRIRLPGRVARRRLLQRLTAAPLLPADWIAAG